MTNRGHAFPTSNLKPALAKVQQQWKGKGFQIKHNPESDIINNRLSIQTYILVCRLLYCGGNLDGTLNQIIYIYKG